MNLEQVSKSGHRDIDHREKRFSLRQERIVGGQQIASGLVLSVILYVTFGGAEMFCVSFLFQCVNCKQHIVN